ncbi:MAG: 3-hydroxybutyryl-CoA dehydrogenase [Candidatus Kapabacteria bacterium]|nr:3-hydroxybutyryl-CoA dehydrogenase [Candidatus Kapabacteria bacterium]
MMVAICGAGTMGRGIALSSLLANHSVIITDQHGPALDQASAYIGKQLQSSVEKGRITAEQQAAMLGSLRTTTDLHELADADLVIEAIVERLDVKHELFKTLEAICRPTCILSSNTSSISISALARCLADPSRFVGLHFFNPAHIMKLVEVVSGMLTAPHVIDMVTEFAKGLGKTTVLAKDAPGFIVNRVARNFYNEAQRIVMEGAATVEQTDRCMKALGFKMGPFELMDLIGVDVNLDVTTSMWGQFFYEPRFTPSLLQQQIVHGGLHGRKTGRGFYPYES